jgi:HTH-type transcriptional regulator / antitoxin HigA
MSTIEIQRVTQAWELLPALRVPHTEEEYDHLVAWLDELIDVVGNDEDHPLVSLMDVIGTLIESYEDETLPDFA